MNESENTPPSGGNEPPRSRPSKRGYVLHFTGGIASRRIEATSKKAAETAGRKLSGSFAFAEPVEPEPDAAPENA